MTDPDDERRVLRDAASAPVQCMLGFVERIGLSWEPAQLAHPTLLPGLEIRAGRLRVDFARLAFPGDILHEAGHLALVPAAERSRVGPEGLDDPAVEIAALAWSYAACLHLGLPPELVFHEHGYKGNAAGLLEALRRGAVLGQPVLAWLGLTDFGRDAQGPHVFPAMRRWLRE